MKTFYASLLVGLCASLVACGPKVTLSPNVDTSFGSTVAVLPANYPADVQRERVDYLHELLRNELRNSGFFVLDPRVVQVVCSTPDCPERQELADRYGAKLFLEFDVESSSEVNFLAGYYNSLEGEIRISDSMDVELARIEHVERERGGVVFESGQVIQGILAQLNNGSEESRNNLGSKFVRELAGEIPRPAGETGSVRTELQVKIDRVLSTTVRSSVQEVCVQGSVDSLAILHLGTRKSSLREVSPGLYCGRFRFDSQANGAGKVVAELRSPFGTSARKELEIVPERMLTAPQTLATQTRSL